MISNIFRDFASIQVQFEKMPAGLIHNDIVLHNILAHGDELKGIIDFSDMVFSPYIQNVAVAFTQCFFTYNWQPNQAGIFLKNYMQHHPLSSEELSVLRTLVAGRFAMLIVAFNHWNVAFGVDEQRTEFIRDNVGFLNRFMEISEQEFSELVALV